MLHVGEYELDIPVTGHRRDLLDHLGGEIHRRLARGEVPVRFAVSAIEGELFRCEVAVVSGVDDERLRRMGSIFDFASRGPTDHRTFDVVLIVPTGVGCAIGGHAGDAGPVARLLATMSDTLVTHPNVVGAWSLDGSDGRCLCVEGSLLSSFLMGATGLRPVRSNRVLTVVDDHPDPLFVTTAVNAVSSARASRGVDCPEIVRLQPPLRLEAVRSRAGRTVGEVQVLDRLVSLLEDQRDRYDAVALSTRIIGPPEHHLDYPAARGGVVHPWGGAAATLTHALAQLLGVPVAHAPMVESREIADLELGVVDPRMAASDVASGSLVACLETLSRSPQPVRDAWKGRHPGMLTAADVDCVVQPDGCLGLPTLAALQHRIPVVAVAENRSILDLDLAALPWAEGSFHAVANYWEAAGVVAALRAGLDPHVLRRPLADTVELIYAEGSLDPALDGGEGPWPDPSIPARSSRV